MESFCEDLMIKLSLYHSNKVCKHWFDIIIFFITHIFIFFWRLSITFYTQWSSAHFQWIFSSYFKFIIMTGVNIAYFFHIKTTFLIWFFCKCVNLHKVGMNALLIEFICTLIWHETVFYFSILISIIFKDDEKLMALCFH